MKIETYLQKQRLFVNNLITKILINLHWSGKYNFHAANGVCWSYKVDWISSLLFGLSTRGLSITLVTACDLFPVPHNNGNALI